MPSTKRSPKDPFLTKWCSRGKYPVTWEPKGMATVLYKPAKAGCMRLLAVDKSPCSSRFAHRVVFLHVKSTVASGQKQVGALAHTSATRLCCFEQPIAPSTRHCMVWLWDDNLCSANTLHTDEPYLVRDGGGEQRVWGGMLKEGTNPRSSDRFRLKHENSKS